MPLPLLVGRDGFHETPLDEESCRGMLVVRGKPHLRDGVLAQRCLCGCSQRACGLESDVDVRFLNDPSNFETGECVFRGPLFFPPYAEVVEVARSRGITNTAKAPTRRQNAAIAPRRDRKSARLRWYSSGV